MRLRILIILICLTLKLSAQNVFDVDICVYGGTSAGVIAAYTAKKTGKSVLLIEPGKHLGGLSSGGLGFTDIGNKYAVTGLARDFYRRIGKHYGKFEQWIFEPHVAENTFQQYIQEGGVEVLYDHRIVSAIKQSGEIQNIAVENADHPSLATNKIIRAKMFIDCSYEGDLMKLAGVSYTVGRESNRQYNETYNGFQIHHKHQFVDGIDPYKIKGDASSGLLWGISEESVQPQGTGDKKVQAYNFRICLTRNPSNRISITRPQNYDSTKYELLLRVLEREPNKPFNLILKPDLMPNDKTDINNNGPFSTDMIGMNYDYPEADYETRKAIIKDHEEYIKGLLYFIGHDPRMPKHLREEMLTWGYPKDEYKDNNHWSHQAYIREARRMIGSYVMTQHNCEGKAIVDDGVGMAAYTMDSHNTQRLVINGMVKNEGDVQVGGFPPYPIAYRSLIPKQNECTNLLVPVCLSATHIAYGSIRMEPVFMVLGQSTALAAAQAIDAKCAVQEINVTKLQKMLQTDPLMNSSTPEILIDNDDKNNVTKSKNWITVKNYRGGYGQSVLTDTTKSNDSFVKYSPDIKSQGNYKILIYMPKSTTAPATITVEIEAQKKVNKNINLKDMVVEGQTSGEWIDLGVYILQKGNRNNVKIRSSQQGAVIADAVLFIKSNH